MKFVREMFGAAFILAGVAVPLLAVAIRSGEGLVFPLVFGGLSLWCGYLMLHGPRGGGR